MLRPVFISYCHKQGEWVWDHLVPCLRAGGVKILIDRERFQAGKAVTGQMDATQDRAKLNVLVLSPDYLRSKYCYHELKRAVDRDPRFQNGLVVPVKRIECDCPTRLKAQNTLFVDLRNDKNDVQWDLLFKACNADLGTPAPTWLTARDQLDRYLRRGQSVNLILGITITTSKLRAAHRVLS